MNSRNILRASLHSLALAFLLISPRAAADGVAWTNLLGGNFSDPNNWRCSPGGLGKDYHCVPSAGDTVAFPNVVGVTVTVDGNFQSAWLDAEGWPFNVVGSYDVAEVFIAPPAISGRGTFKAGKMIAAGIIRPITGTRVIVGRLELYGVSPAGVLTNLVLSGGAWLTTSDLFCDQGAGNGIAIQGAGTKWEYLVGTNLLCSAFVSGGGLLDSPTHYPLLVAVSDPGSMWLSGPIGTVGLKVSNGGLARCSSVDWSTQGAALVEGANSLWDISGNVSGIVDQLVITNGGTVKVQKDVLLNKIYAFTIGGINSNWKIGGALKVGGSNPIYIKNGGAVSAQDCELGSTGLAAQLIVSDHGSKLSLTQFLTVGASGGGILDVSRQGQVDCDFGSLGTFASGSGNVTIDGDASVWNVRKGLFVGDAGYGLLRIRGGGRVQISANGSAMLGVSGFAANGEIDITGTNSLLDATSAEVVVGGEGTAKLDLFENGELRAESITLGSEPGSFGWVQVTDAFLSATEDIIVGKEGEGRLGIENLLGFGNVTAQARTLYIGQSFDTNTVTVDGLNAILDLSGDLFIGDGGLGTMTVFGGGQVAVRGFNIIVSSRHFSKGSLLVDRVGSKIELLRQGSEMIVGDKATGEFKVTQGGQLIVSALSIGSTKADGNGEVVGTNSLLRVMNQARIGFGNFPGSLSVSTNAVAQIDHDLVLAKNGAVLVTGGMVNVGDTVILTNVSNTIIAPPVLRVAGVGTLSGNGTVTANVLVENGGKVVVGDSFSRIPVGRLRIEGDYEQRPGLTTTLQPTLELDIAGSTPDTQHDVLDVTNRVNLAGNLMVHFVNGFAPVAGQQFDIIWFGNSLAGAFGNVQITGVAAGFQYELKITSPGRYSLIALGNGVATSPPLLSIQRAGNQLEISWPITATGFSLQSAASLGSPNWRTIPTAANRFTAPITGTMEFFRLAKP